MKKASPPARVSNTEKAPHRELFSFSLSFPHLFDYTKIISSQLYICNYLLARGSSDGHLGNSSLVSNSTGCLYELRQLRVICLEFVQQSEILYCAHRVHIIHL